MWSRLALCLFVGLAYASNNPAWKDNAEYVYMARGRTVASLYEVSNQFSGVLFKAKLRLQPKPDGKLFGQICDAEYSQVHTHLHQWNMDIPDAELSWKPLEHMTKEPFQVEMKAGVITDIIVNKDISNWEANMIRSILSQFQLNTNEYNVERSSDNFPDSAVFTTMEDTVTGNVETLYKINRAPEYIIRSKPWGQQVIDLKGEGKIIEIMKHKNYSNSVELPVYSHGFGSTFFGGPPGTNAMGHYFVRDSTSRAIIYGSLQKYTIHHSYTFSRVMANPTLQDRQKGAVHSLMNVTLEELKAVDQPIASVSKPVRLGNLVYSYGSPYAVKDMVQEKRPYEQQMKMNGDDILQRNRMMNGLRWRSLDFNENLAFEDLKSSEESYKKPQPSLEEAPETPLLPFTIGHNGVSIKKVQNVVKMVTTLCQEIGNDLQETKRNMQETLSKFTTLGALMRILSADQMKGVASELYCNNDGGPKRNAWQVFRDSVAETGTGPALLTIQSWINSKKIKNSEAALVLVTMMRSVRQPTLQYMKTAFELVKCKEVQSEWPLNATALLTFGDLVHKVYVNSRYSEMQYPGKSFEKFQTEEGKKFVKESVIPAFTEKLHESISNGESRKILTYIIALGNIGHPEILHSFEPYLEGKKQCSQFQRLAMVYSLTRLTFVYPIPTRNALFRIYQNIGEVEKVRVAAVISLMLTSPPREMLQYMASYTNVDVHEYVNAAVKNNIEQLGETNIEQLKHVRDAARAARPLLTKKEYGMQFVSTRLESQLIKELGYRHQDELLLLGSHESWVPEMFRFAVIHNIKGHSEHLLTLSGGISSIDELIHVFKLQTEGHNKDRKQQQQKFEEQKQNKWSSQYLASLLNLEVDEREQLEGGAGVGFNGLATMFSFNNRTIEQMTREFEKYEEELKQGKKIDFIKLINNRPLALSFPTEMGLPFLFTRESPILFRAKGSLKVTATPQVFQDKKIRKPESIQLESDMSVLVSGKRQGQLSFVTPFDHHQYIAGYDKHWQVFAPLTANVEVDVKESQVKAEVKPCQDESEASFFQYSTQPYTSRIDISNIQPILSQQNTHLIKQSNLRTYDKFFGEKQTGLSLRVQMRHERQLIDTSRVMNLLWKGGVADTFFGLWEDSEIQQSQINITHVIPRSATRKFIIRLGKQEEYYKIGGGSSDEQFSSSENPQQRQKEALKKAALGIKSVTSQVYDASVDFQGDQAIKYRLTLAFAKSNVDPKSKIILDFKKESERTDVKPYMLSFEAKNVIPNTNGLDLEYSMRTEPKVDSEMRLVFGENPQDVSRLEADWEFRRSEERKQFLRGQPLYHQCQQDQRKGNKQTAACLNMTVDSNLLDKVAVKVQYNNLKPEWEDLIKVIFDGFRMKNLPSISIDYEDKCRSRNEIDMVAAFDPDLRSLNMSVKTSQQKTTLVNYPINEWTKEIAVLHPVYHVRSRLLGKSLGIPSYRPSCVVDRSQIKTFINMNFPVKCTPQWTLMVQYIPKEARHISMQQSIEDQLKNQVENFAILVRQNPQNEEKKDLKITLSAPETEFKVVDITMISEQSGPLKAKVLVNGKQVNINDKESYDIGKDYIQIYALPNREVKLEIKDVLYTLFDGERVRVTATGSLLKNANRGICGQFSNNKVENFVTPSECYVNDVHKFVKSYEIEGKDGQSVREELSRDRKQCVHKNVPLYVNVVKSRDEQSSGKCSFFQTRYIEQNNEICFTIRSMPACRSGCQPQGTVTKDVPVHCIQSTPVAQLWKSQIDKGANPDFSHKRPTKSVPMQLPQGCAE